MKSLVDVQPRPSAMFHQHIRKLYTGQGFLSDLIAPYLYYPIGVLQNMNTEHTNSQLNDIFPRSFLKNRRVAPRRPLY